jgi:4-hydroxy-tetrahydrodipicolinate reductase
MKPINIMVNGMPGNMAVNVAAHALKDPRFNLVPASLTGPEITASEHSLPEMTFRLLPPDKVDNAISGIVEMNSPFISIDYTHPTAVNANAEFYCRHSLPFVMGTTGGDRKQLLKTVNNSTISAVIAPNMAKQIVGFQAMMAYAAENFPGLFIGYSLEIKESHQQGKADTSGTAKAMVDYFNALGMPFSVTDIKQERDPQTQKTVWGIPDEYLSGHGWHTYTLASGDGTVRFDFTHNVNGRDVYIGGTLDAVLFLQKKIQESAGGKVFSMIDVLKTGIE